MDKAKEILDILFKKNRFLKIVLFTFCIQALYIALTFPFGVPADEQHHIIVSLMHKNSLNPFIEEPETLKQFITISTSPFLYHYLLGLLSNLNFYNLPMAIFMRFSSPVFGIATLIMLYKTSYLITKDKLKSLFAVTLLASTMMFMFSSGVVNYDNLVNLLSISSVFFFIRFYQDFKITDLLNLLIIILLGLLTKFTLLPLAFILFVLTLWVMFINRKNFQNEIKYFCTSTKFIKKLFYIVILILVSSLFIILYGKNIIQYKSVMPSCEIVASHDECYEYSYSYRIYYDGFISETDNDAEMNIVKDMKEWTKLNLNSIYGIITHRGFFFRTYSIIPFTIIALTSLIGICMSLVKREKFKTEIIFIGIIFVFYALVLLQHNYKEYLTSSMWNGTQGRYLLPVWPLLYIIFAQYALNFKNETYKRILILIFFIIALVTSFGVYYHFKPANYLLNWHEIKENENFYSDLIK